MSQKLKGHCGACALWIKRKPAVPQKGLCVNTQQIEVENFKCWKFVDRKKLTTVITKHERKCSNCVLKKKCKKGAFYEGKAEFCKGYVSKNLAASLKKNKE